MRLRGCLAGQYNAMGPEVRFSISYTEHCLSKRSLSKNNVLLIVNGKQHKSIPCCTKRCRNIQNLK